MGGMIGWVPVLLSSRFEAKVDGALLTRGHNRGSAERERVGDW